MTVGLQVVCNTAKVRFFKQITTYSYILHHRVLLFAIQQKYDFSSKSQLQLCVRHVGDGCLQYSKSTIFQANHNLISATSFSSPVVCNTAKVRFFKQITTNSYADTFVRWLFAIQQKYDFSSKSQLNSRLHIRIICCLQYSKSTIFQANHNCLSHEIIIGHVVCNTAKVRFFKQITTNC